MRDRLTTRLRAARPGTVRRGDPLSERGRALRAHYAAAEARPGRRTAPPAMRWRRPATTRLAGIAAATAVLALGVVVAETHMDQPALAHTPPMLEVTPIEGTASELLTAAARKRLEGPKSGNVIKMWSWALATEKGDGRKDQSSVVEPMWTEMTFGADGSVRVLRIAADPFEGDKQGEFVKPGTVLMDETYPKGSPQLANFGPAPEDAADVGPYLSRVWGADTLAPFESMRAIAKVMSSVPVSREQEAAIVAYLAHAPGIEVKGKVFDRVGREGIALGLTHPDSTWDDMLIVAPDTGEILAAEVIYRGKDRTDIASPSVIDYVAWGW